MTPNLAWSVEQATGTALPAQSTQIPAVPCCLQPSPHGPLGDSSITFPESGRWRNEAAAASPGKLMEFAREYYRVPPWI